MKIGPNGDLPFPEGYNPLWDGPPGFEVTGYTQKTFFLKRWFGYPKYTKFQKINGRFVIVGYKETLQEEKNVPISQKNSSNT